MSSSLHWRLLVVAAVLIAGLVALVQQHRQAETAQAARYAAWRNQRDYQAESVACRVRFARGGVSRATPFEAAFRWRGLPAELVSGSDDVEGETWAEFYDSGSADAARRHLASFSADLSHRLLRQRLWSFYFRDRPDATDDLATHWQSWITGSEAGWQVSIRWLPTPHGLAEVAPPPQPPVLATTTAVVSELQRLGQLQAPPADWAWYGRDDPLNPDRDGYRAALDQVRANWRDDAARRSEFQQRFEREHRHFYLVEAARDLGSGHVLILRRFGAVVGPGTLQRAAGEIGAMIASLHCLDAERPSG